MDKTLRDQHRPYIPTLAGFPFPHHYAKRLYSFNFHHHGHIVPRILAKPGNPYNNRTQEASASPRASVKRHLSMGASVTSRLSMSGNCQISRGRGPGVLRTTRLRSPFHGGTPLFYFRTADDARRVEILPGWYCLSRNYWSARISQRLGTHFKISS